MITHIYLNYVRGVDISPTFNAANLYEFHNGIAEEYDGYVANWREHNFVRERKMKLQRFYEEQEIRKQRQNCMKNKKSKECLVCWESKGLEVL